MFKNGQGVSGSVGVEVAAGAIPAPVSIPFQQPVGTATSPLVEFDNPLYDETASVTSPDSLKPQLERAVGFADRLASSSLTSAGAFSDRLASSSSTSAGAFSDNGLDSPGLSSPVPAVATIASMGPVVAGVQAAKPLSVSLPQSPQASAVVSR